MTKYGLGWDMQTKDSLSFGAPQLPPLTVNYATVRNRMGEHVAPTTPAKKKRSNIFWNIVGVVGELLITFAFVIGLFSVWQLYWTTYQVSGQVSQTIASYEEEHQPAKRTQGEIRTETRPPSTAKSATAKSTASSTCPPGTG